MPHRIFHRSGLLWSILFFVMQLGACGSIIQPIPNQPPPLPKFATMQAGGDPGLPAAVVAIVGDDSWTEDGELLQLRVQTLRMKDQICDQQPLPDVLAARLRCTGVLLSAQILLTASPCVHDKHMNRLRVIRGFAAHPETNPFFKDGQIVRTAFRVAEVGQPAAIIGRSASTQAGPGWVLVRLVRAFPGPFARLAPDARPATSAGRELLVLGHPRGMPLVSTRGRVRLVAPPGAKALVLGYFAGSVGAPVFEESTSYLVGLLAYGTDAPDWITPDPPHTYPWTPSPDLASQDRKHQQLCDKVVWGNLGEERPAARLISLAGVADDLTRATDATDQR